MRAGIALGSNIGDSAHHLRRARQAIADLPNVQLLATSSMYETDPIDCEPGAAKFLNGVLEVEFKGDATELFQQLKGIEAAMGRPEKHPRNVSRKIDIDLLYFGDSKVDEPELQLPHPRMHHRRFVLEPLAEIRPDLVVPGQQKTVRQLLAQTNDSGKVVRLNNDWRF